MERDRVGTRGKLGGTDDFMHGLWTTANQGMFVSRGRTFMEVFSLKKERIRPVLPSIPMGTWSY